MKNPNGQFRIQILKKFKKFSMALLGFTKFKSTKKIHSKMHTKFFGISLETTRFLFVFKFHWIIFYIYIFYIFHTWSYRHLANIKKYQEEDSS